MPVDEVKQYAVGLAGTSQQGHVRVVQLLLDRGANINARSGGSYSNTVQTASAGGHEEIVELLLDKGTKGA